MNDIHIFYLTDYCNLNCTYCYQKGTHNNNRMTKETIKNKIEKIASSKPSIIIYGGEALLNKENVYYMLDLIYDHNNKGRNINATLITNGTLLDKPTIKMLLKYKSFLKINISIDGDKSTNDHYRITKDSHGTYDTVIYNSKIALTYFPFIAARVTINNIEKMYDNVMHLYNIGFKHFYLQLCGHIKETDEYYDQIKRIREKFKTLIHAKIIFPPVSHVINDNLINTSAVGEIYNIKETFEHLTYTEDIK